MINVKNLTKTYGSFTAVNHISFHVKKGEMLGFLGVNGAGKSTTINILSTLLKPDGGEARVCGYTLGREDEAIRRNIGIVYQQNCLDDILTVQENLIYRGVLHGTTREMARKRILELSEILSLDELLKKRFRNLSGGQKRRCEIAAALMHTPSLLFLDEPTTGLDPATRKDVWKTIESIRKETGMTVFLTTHYMEEAATANRIIILEQGTIRADGTPFELKEKYAIDTVRLFCSDNNKVELKNQLAKHGFNIKPEDYGFSFAVKNTRDSIEPVYALRDLINGYEVVQGNMDDVFLNACHSMGSTAGFNGQKGE